MVDPLTAGFAWAGMVATGKLAWNGLRRMFGSKKPKRNPIVDELESRANNAENKLGNVTQQLDDANRRLRQGIQPVVHPTREEIERVKRDRQYDPYNIHFAVAGISGSGKSSLVNAIRGLANNHQGRGRVADTGANETTRVVGRYPMTDLDQNDPRVWYDVPGAGTLNIPDWQYFNSQGLYIFDAIIVLFDNRFTQTDLAILQNAGRFNIPTFIVRSKSEVHIDNIMRNMPGFPDDDDDLDEDTRARYLHSACRQYVQETRASVADNLKRAWQSSPREQRNDRLLDKRVYLVSKGTLTSVVNDTRLSRRKILLDEQDLLEDLANVVLSRRF